MRASLLVRVAVVGVGLFTFGCAGAESAHGSSAGSAVSTASAASTAARAVRVAEVSVLSRRVNLQRPVSVAAEPGGEISVTFARRQLEGAKLTIGPDSLRSRLGTEFEYAAPPQHGAAPYLAPAPAHVKLEGGAWLECWTDETQGRVLAQAYGADGAPRGEPVVVSPDTMDVFGAPVAATADGHRVFVTFFASDSEGFELVAAALDTSR